MEFVVLGLVAYAYNYTYTYSKACHRIGLLKYKPSKKIKWTKLLNIDIYTLSIINETLYVNTGIGLLDS